MVNDRFELYESTSACSWRSWRKSGYIKDKRGLNSKMYLAVNERGLPAKSIVTDGTRADCKEAVKLLKNIDVKLLFADRAYDTNEILSYIARRNIKSVIPPKRNKLEQRGYNCKLYRFRHIIENTFLAFKRWRGIATRYAKTLDAFIASIYVRCIFMYLSFF